MKRVFIRHLFLLICGIILSSINNFTYASKYNDSVTLIIEDDDGAIICLPDRLGLGIYGGKYDRGFPCVFGFVHEDAEKVAEFFSRKDSNLSFKDWVKKETGQYDVNIHIDDWMALVCHIHRYAYPNDWSCRESVYYSDGFHLIDERIK